MKHITLNTVLLETPTTIDRKKPLVMERLLRLWTGNIYKKDQVRVRQIEVRHGLKMMNLIASLKYSPETRRLKIGKHDNENYYLREGGI